MTFLWLKAFHMIAVVTWFAAMVYLPRLFVYHADADDAVSRERFKLIERKLYRGIMTPSMVIVIALGVWMLTMNSEFYFSQGWMHAKLTLVMLLVAYHFYCGHLLRLFRDDNNTRSPIFYRWISEIPVFLLVGIVILVVVRPF